jgi:hypothetical protein
VSPLPSVVGSGERPWEAALEGAAFRAAGTLVGGVIAAAVKRLVLLRVASPPSIGRGAGSIALEALFLHVIFKLVPSFR